MLSFILHILAAIMLVAGLYLVFSRNKETRSPWAWRLAAIGLVLLMVIEAVTIIPTGYVGVRSVFGQYKEEMSAPGIGFKVPFVEKVNAVSTKLSDKRHESKIYGDTSEKTPVYAENVTVTYAINPQKAVWIYSNVSNADNLITGDVVDSAVRDAMNTLPNDKVTIRSYIEPVAKEHLTAALNEKYGEDVLTIYRVTIPNMDFDPEYNAAIAAKSNAAKEQETKAIENQTNIERAEAEKKTAIINAEKQAETAKIIAEGEAQAKLIQAEAEVKVNEMITTSLTDEVLKNKFYEKWNGVLPKVMGDEAVITNIGE